MQTGTWPGSFKRSQSKVILAGVVHTCARLMRAHSPEEAYDKALRLGQEEEITYENSDGKGVKIVFRGLTDLIGIYEDLENGAELTYEEEIGVKEDEIKKMLTEREHLSVFQEGRGSDGPNYIAKDIAEEIEGRSSDDPDRDDGTI